MGKCVQMVQVGRYRWNLFAPKGHILVEDMNFADGYRAEQWVKSYVSSWNDWSYVIKPLQAGDKWIR